MNVATCPIPIRRSAKLNSGLFEEMVIDNFAGGGGASRGIEAAIGRAVDVAVNHDEDAVRTHQLNHPHTRHLCESVWDVVPEEVTAGRKVGFAWFSPDCCHFSRAKGGKPVKKSIRGLAWVVIKWAKRVRPRVIVLENVREFQTWGPLTAEMQPCPARKGDTFRRWVAQLRNLGYAVEWRELNAADFGAPTHRRRFFLIARCDAQPIIWPDPTHGAGRRPYHTAAECIDWSRPCPSIFLTKEEAKPLRIIRPLADKTMRRIALGLKKYVIDNPKPFIVKVQHGGQDFRGQSIDEPLQTITEKHGTGIVAPSIVRCAHGDNCATGKARWGRGDVSVEVPLPTLTGSKDFALVLPFLTQRYGEAPHQETRGQPVDRPIHTVTPANNSGVLIAPTLIQYNQEKGNEVRGGGIKTPLNTVVTENRFGIIAPTLIGAGGPDYAAKPRAVDRPIGTLLSENRTAVTAAFIAKHYGGVVGHGPERPLGTVTAIDHHSVIAAHLLKFRGNSAGSSADEPLPTITSGAGAARPAGAAHAMGITAAHMVKMNHGEKQWSGVDEPVRTILAGANHHGVVETALEPEQVAASLIKLRGQCAGAAADEPAPTVTAGGNHVAAVSAFLCKYYSCGGQGQTCDQPLHTIPAQDRYGLVTVAGEPYRIVDIGMRMLEPAELLRAQFGKYAKDYILTGPKWLQVKLIGNSVCPQMAEAIVRANYSEKAEVAA